MFESLEEQNDHLQHWERTVADTRIHGTTRQQVARAFTAEKPSLQALPTERFPFFHEGQRSVNRDGHAEVDKSYYSVPPEYVGRRVWARWDSRLVRILNRKLEVITTHAKVGPGKFSTHPEHLHSSKISAVERGGQWLLRKASDIGPHAEEWAVALFNHRGIQALRTLQGLLSLTEKYESQSIDAACQIAHSYGSYQLASIRRLMETKPSLQHEFEFTNEHPIIRDITVYGELVRDSIKSQAKRLEHSPLRSPRKDYHE